MQYRREIDGLRAIAVTSVILYHAGFVTGGIPHVTGGFVGVDVFFVISGYLISKIIFSEMKERGQLRISNFYIRRARRIMPTLLCVVAASSIGAYQLLDQSALYEFAKSAKSSILFFSNFHFYLSATEYGATSSLLLPLLHTWSLSVEEQFYIVFPLLAWTLYHLRFSITAQTVCIVALLIISFAVCIYVQMDKLQLAFFLPFTRAWELLSGTLLALAEQRFGRARHSAFADSLATIGALMLAFAIFKFDDKTAHPSILTAIPVFGTFLIIAFTRPDRGVGVILSARPLVAIGLISYSLYLWHYPILAFLRTIDLNPSNLDKIIAITLTGIFSIVSYHLVERPFRYKFSNNHLITSTTLLAAGMIIISWWTIASAGFPQRLYAVYSAEAQKTELEASFEFTNFSGDINGYKPILLVIGDSYLTNWSIALNRHFDKNRFDIVNLSYLGCAVEMHTDHLEVEPHSAHYERSCQTLVTFLNDKSITSRVKAIFLVSHRPFEYTVNTFRFNLIKWISLKSKLDVDKFVFSNYYQLDSTHIDSCLGLMHRTKRDASVCLEKSNYPTDSKIENLPYYPNDLLFTYLDVVEAHCEYDRRKCSYQKNGIPFMLDNNHLTATFLLELFNKIKPPPNKHKEFNNFFEYFSHENKTFGDDTS